MPLHITGFDPRALAAACATALLVLAGCKDSTGPSGGTPPAARPAGSGVSVEAIESQAKGFSVGPVMSSRVVYVFFDTQCPHCAALWDAAKPLKAQARFVWVPVGVLGPDSLVQGAAILAAPDPAAAMEAHEQTMRESKRGIVPAGNVDTQKEAVTRNTKLLDGFGIGSVPTLVMKQAGGVKVQEGSMPTDALAKWIGAQP